MSLAKSVSVVLGWGIGRWVASLFDFLDRGWCWHGLDMIMAAVAALSSSLQIIYVAR